MTSTFRSRRDFLLFPVLIGVISVIMLHPMRQDQSYHRFVDTRTVAGVVNGWNVLSNILFIIPAGYALLSVRKVTGTFKAVIIVLATGLLMTCVGSAWYHFNPTDATLVWDRLPMTLVFMSFLTAVIAGRIGAKLAAWLLSPLLLIGIASVCWWRFTGDLRFYGLVQFFPVFLVVYIFLVYPARVRKVQERQWLLYGGVILWYGIAKLCEHYDRTIFETSGFISGHTLKHLFAAVAAWWLVKLVLALDAGHPAK